MPAKAAERRGRPAVWILRFRDGMTAEASREEMVALQLVGRGVQDPLVLEAFRSVPRDAFVPAKLAEFAYQDSPLPIGRGQTISQPYVVAVTLEALSLRGNERVLEIGTGSGYAAAVAARIAREVYTIERIEELASQAQERLARLGYENVHVLCGDGTLGWPEHAPYDAIAVAAGGPSVPRSLRAQLAVGGRMVIPVGRDESSQTLMRVTRVGPDQFLEESLGEVRFVPLIGAEGWRHDEAAPRATRARGAGGLARLVREVAEPIDDLEAPSLDALLDRMGDARLVLLGEATHGSSEFHRMRASITKALIERRGFDFVAVAADWPCARFPTFPSWMWRNAEVQAFVDWLRAHNGWREPGERVGFHGLDLYSLFSSAAAVLAYLDDIDPQAAGVARARYGALTPWQRDPAAYGRAVLTGRYASSEPAVVAMLQDLLAHRLDSARRDGERFFDAAQTARVVAGAERYYRAMYYGSAAAWNLRDAHMYDTLRALLSFYGPKSRGVVWAHNSHVGDARATEMSARGELNLGQLCRARLRERAYVIGFGTDHGTVAAAAGWDEPMERMRVRPAHPDSYERVFHDTGVPAFALHLREPRLAQVRDELLVPRLERAIGVVYHPESERASHYFQARLPEQFDELVWFDETAAVEPLPVMAAERTDLPETSPFGL